ncbi:MAG: hypothetical protein AAFX06_00160 [Planctomycetota bacterium]
MDHCFVVSSRLALLAEASLAVQIVGCGFGAFIAGAIFLAVHYRAAFRWRQLAARYGVQTAIQGAASRRMESVFLFGAGIAFQSYRGIVNVTVNTEGVGLSIARPFRYFSFCPPLFIPHEEIVATPTDWFVNASSVKLAFRQVPEIELVVSEELTRWIHGVVQGRPEQQIDAHILAGN